MNYCDYILNNKCGTETALIYQERSYSYIELRKIVYDLSQVLLKVGATESELIGVCCYDKLLTILFIIAINAINAVAVPIYPKTGVSKIQDTLREYELTYLIEDGVDIHEQVESSSLFWCQEIKKEYKVTKRLFGSSPKCSGDIAIIMFSSGTMGKQKGVMLSNRNIISNILSISDYLGIKREDIVLHMKQMYHSSSIIAEALLTLVHGATLVVLDGFITPRKTYKTILKYNISIMFTIPTLICEFCNFIKKGSLGCPSLKVINFYGSSIASKAIDELLDCFKGVNLIYSYGLTEASPRVTFAERKVLEKKNNTVGKEINGVTVKVIREDGSECSEGEIGRVTVLGPNVMKGYYNNPLLTKRVIKNKTLLTNDLGYKDDEGLLYIIGRTDNMFVMAGKNVYPEEIEQVLMNTGAFKGVMVEFNDEQQIIAYVEEKFRGIDNVEIYTYCKQYLEDYKIPHRIIPVLELRRTISGKIIRKTGLT